MQTPAASRASCPSLLTLEELQTSYFLTYSRPFVVLPVFGGWQNIRKIISRNYAIEY